MSEGFTLKGCGVGFRLSILPLRRPPASRLPFHSVTAPVTDWQNALNPTKATGLERFFPGVVSKRDIDCNNFSIAGRPPAVVGMRPEIVTCCDAATCDIVAKLDRFGTRVATYWRGG